MSTIPFPLLLPLDQLMLCRDGVLFVKDLSTVSPLSRPLLASSSWLSDTDTAAHHRSPTYSASARVISSFLLCEIRFESMPAQVTVEKRAKNCQALGLCASRKGSGSLPSSPTRCKSMNVRGILNMILARVPFVVLFKILYLSATFFAWFNWTTFSF